MLGIGVNIPGAGAEGVGRACANLAGQLTALEGANGEAAVRVDAEVALVVLPAVAAHGLGPVRGRCEPAGDSDEWLISVTEIIGCIAQVIRARNSRVCAAQVDVDGGGLALGRADAARVHWGMSAGRVRAAQQSGDLLFRRLADPDGAAAWLALRRAGAVLRASGETRSMAARRASIGCGWCEAQKVCKAGNRNAQFV